MPDSHPDAPTLLAAACSYLENELLPALSGYHRFQCRVAVNALNIVRREMESGPEFAAAERERLLELMGLRNHPEDANAPLLWINGELCRQIRNGRRDIDNPALRAHIRRSLVEALSINNPKWLTR